MKKIRIMAIVLTMLTFMMALTACNAKDKDLVVISSDYVKLGDTPETTRVTDYNNIPMETTYPPEMVYTGSDWVESEIPAATHTSAVILHDENDAVFLPPKPDGVGVNYITNAAGDVYHFSSWFEKVIEREADEPIIMYSDDKIEIEAKFVEIFQFEHEFVYDFETDTQYAGFIIITNVSDETCDNLELSFDGDRGRIPEFGYSVKNDEILATGDFAISEDDTGLVVCPWVCDQIYAAEDMGCGVYSRNLDLIRSQIDQTELDLGSLKPGEKTTVMVTFYLMAPDQ